MKLDPGEAQRWDQRHFTLVTQWFTGPERLAPTNRK